MESPSTAANKIAASVEVRILAAVDSDNIMGLGGGEELPWEFEASGQLEHMARKVAGHTVVLGGPMATRVHVSRIKARVLVMDTQDTLRREVEVIQTPREAIARCRPGGRLYVMGDAATLQAFLPHATRVDLYTLDVPLSQQDARGFARKAPVRFPSMPTAPLLVVVDPRRVESCKSLPFCRVSHELDPVTNALTHIAKIDGAPTQNDDEFDVGRLNRALQRSALDDKTLAAAFSISEEEAEREESIILEMALMQSFYESKQGMRSSAEPVHGGEPERDDREGAVEIQQQDAPTSADDHAGDKEQ